MELGLRNKLAVVTGSSRGIGRSIAMGLADEGCKLVVCARGEQFLQKTAGELQEEGVEVVAVTADVGKEGGASLITGTCIPADGCQGHSMI